MERGMGVRLEEKQQTSKQTTIAVLKREGGFVRARLAWTTPHKQH